MKDRVGMAALEMSRSAVFYDLHGAHLAGIRFAIGTGVQRICSTEYRLAFRARVLI